MNIFKMIRPLILEESVAVLFLTHFFPTVLILCLRDSSSIVFTSTVVLSQESLKK